MNKLILLSLFLFAFHISDAQINALTDSGRQVILFNNGTWKYVKEDTHEKRSTPDTIKLNPSKFSKSSGATFLVKSNKVNIGVYINPDKWTLKTHLENETNPEYRFNLKSDEGFALLITEKTQFSLASFGNIALKNAQKAAIDAKIINQEYRLVNDTKVLFLEITGTIQGIKFKYLGYYFSDEKGTIQLVTYGAETTVKESYAELEAFLNGFVVIK